MCEIYGKKKKKTDKKKNYFVADKGSFRPQFCYKGKLRPTMK